MTELQVSDVRVRIIRAINRAGGEDKLAKKIGIGSSHMREMMWGRRAWCDALLNHIGVERATVFYGTKGWKP